MNKLKNIEKTQLFNNCFILNFYQKKNCNLKKEIYS